MDFVVRLIGIIIIATGGTTPDIRFTTALAPLATQASYCSGQKTVEPHTAYIRVSQSSNPDESQWAHSDECDASAGEKCYLFEIPSGSELAIGPEPQGQSMKGSSYCQLPSLRGIDPAIHLIANPRSKSYFAYELPAATLEGVALANGAVATYFWAHGSSSQITITATPFGYSVPSKTLKVNAGTTINIVYLPKHDAIGNLASFHPQPSNLRHFYLANELLGASDQICGTPPSPRPLIIDWDGTITCGSANGDPFCSNNGCCP